MPTETAQTILKKVFGYETFRPHQLEIIENNWLPSKGETISVNDFNDKLKNLTLLGTCNNSKISLSLSGGMDSRVILSLLLNSNYENWDCHTFRTEDKMDINIAEIIFVLIFKFLKSAGNITEDGVSHHL